MDNVQNKDSSADLIISIFVSIFGAGFVWSYKKRKINPTFLLNAIAPEAILNEELIKHVKLAQSTSSC